MSTLKEYSTDLSFTATSKTLNLSLDSTLQELPLYDIQFEFSCSGQDVARAFQENPSLPGVILTERGRLAGMISRRRFLEQMSLPYAQELFSRRSITSFYRFVMNLHLLKFQGDTKIVEAARIALQRPEQLVYEPILVEINPDVSCLLDMQKLLLADSQIHQLTCHLLNKEMTATTQALKQQIEKMSRLEPKEKISHLGQMIASVTAEMKNPVHWNKNLEFLFLYCKQIRETLLMYEASIKQQPSAVTEFKEEVDLDVICTDLPQILQTMKTDSERLNKFIRGLQILLENILNQ